MARLQRATHLVRVTFIVKHERMNVAVAGVKNIRNAQTVLPAALANEPHHLRQLRSRHNAILRDEIRTEPANRAERAFPRLPEISTLLVGFGKSHLARAVLAANLNDR